MTNPSFIMAALRDNEGIFLPISGNGRPWTQTQINYTYPCIRTHTQMRGTLGSFIFQQFTNNALNVNFMDTHIRVDRLSRHNANLMHFGFKQWTAAISPYGGAETFQGNVFVCSIEICVQFRAK